MVARDAIEEMHLGAEAGTEDLAGLEGFFKGMELTEEFRLGVTEDLSFRVLTEEGMNVFKTCKNKSIIKPKTSVRKIIIIMF